MHTAMFSACNMHLNMRFPMYVTPLPGVLKNCLHIKKLST